MTRPRPKWRLAGLLALLGLGGCVSIGANYDPAAVDRLQPGMSVEQVHGLLGLPNSVSTLPNGTHIEVWLHSTGTALGTGRARSVSILFDASNQMERVINTTQTEIH